MTNVDLECISLLGTINQANFHSEIAVRSQEFFLHVISNVPEAQSGRKVRNLFANITNNLVHGFTDILTK